MLDAALTFTLTVLLEDEPNDVARLPTTAPRVAVAASETAICPLSLL